MATSWSLSDVLRIATGIPFVLVGGVYALWLREIPFSVSAAVGFIALSGIAVLNGQILVVAIRGFVGEGQAMGDAVIRAARQPPQPSSSAGLPIVGPLDIFTTEGPARRSRNQNRHGAWTW